MSGLYHLFVYGTLLSGEKHHGILVEDGRKPLRAARTQPQYTLYDLGEYPAMVAGGATAVTGEVYEVSDLTLAILDSFEDAPTLFHRARIQLEDGRGATAYLWTGAPPEGVLIESGDYRLRAAAGRSFTR